MSSQQGTDPATILVVDDDHAMLTALTGVLADAGFRVAAATNGNDALAEFSRSSPNLVLSNISMPGMDGIQLLEAIRETREGRRIPFVFLTARGTRQDIIAGTATGADGYLTKPITSHELVAVVRARLARFQELKEAFSPGPSGDL
jgi:DNA-binding response OmpR family regulator